MRIDGFNVRTDIKLTPYSRHDGRQRADVRKSDPHADVLSFRLMRNVDRTCGSVHGHGTKIMPILSHLSLLYGAGLQKTNDRPPIVRRPVSQTQSYPIVSTWRVRGSF